MALAMTAGCGGGSDTPTHTIDTTAWAHDLEDVGITVQEWPKYLGVWKDVCDDDADAYSEVPEGTATIHQCWSGDPIAGQYYLPKGETPEVLGYWRPESPADYVIGSDNIAIPKSASKPVLAHLMINDLLDNKIGLRNFGWNGYQPPLTKLSAEYLTDHGYIPKNLMNSVVHPSDFDTGHTFYEVSPTTEALWTTSWSEFKAGA